MSAAGHFQEPAISLNHEEFAAKIDRSTAAKSSRNVKSSPKTRHMPPDLVIAKTFRRGCG